jgi:hypothetical protein
VEKLAHERGILVSAITPLPPGPPPHPAHATRAPATAAAGASRAPAAASHAPAAGASRAPAAASHAPAAGASHAPAAAASRAGTAVGATVAAPPAPAHHPRQKNEDTSAISLIEDEPSADPSAPKGERAHGMITVNANSPSETAHTGAGQIDHGKQVESPMEYHVILNQSLFLLESAVNKHLRDGWEPSGGLSVGVSNNALQFFQAMIRRKKGDGKPGEPAKGNGQPAEPSKPNAPH